MNKMTQTLELTLKWSGGAELIFGNVKKRTFTVTTDEIKGKTLKELLFWLKTDSGFVTGNPDLFFSEDTVKPGVVVLINDSDWELCDEVDYQLENGDLISFISTLHGG